MNVELLRKVAAKITEKPEGFAMHMWVWAGPDYQEDSPCGTTCCIAGEAISMAGAGREANNVYFTATRQLRDRLKCLGIQDVVDETDPIVSNPEALGAELLGLSREQGRRLFYTAAWPDEFRERHAMAKTNAEKAQVAAERIEYMIKTGV